MLLFGIVAFTLLAHLQVVAAQQLDPIKNYCFRFWHSSVVKNDILYIDGGIEGFTNVRANGTQYGNITIGYNTKLIEIDLTQSFNLTSGNITETAYNKTTSSASPTGAPFSLISAAMYQGPPGDNNIYIYGGDTSYWNTSFPGFQGPQSAQYSLFSVNTVNRQYTAHSIGGDAPWRPVNGPGAEAPDLGLAFYYNGELDSGSSSETQVLGDYHKIFLEGMVVLNLTDQTARNVSTDGVSGTDPHTRGILQYIPGIGEKGILVAIGGTTKSVTDLTTSEQDAFVDMSQIGIFDVASLYSSNVSAPNSSWYIQSATGDVPATRAQFCAVTAAAPDNSSWNIYINSGNNQAANSFYDDVYVLSIPSFTWTQISGEGSSPRYGHTCHRIGNRQMINVGGSKPGSFDSCDFETHGVAVFDLSNANWTADYNANDEPYTLPTGVVEAIGGTINGAATVTAPAGGYTQLAIANLFNDAAAYIAPNSTSATASSTPTHHAKRSHVGAIVGGVIGGLALLVLIGLAVFFIMRSKAQQKRRHEAELAAAAATTAAPSAPSDRRDSEMGMVQSPQYATDRYTNEQYESQRLRPELSNDGEVAGWGQELEGDAMVKQLPAGRVDVTSELPGTPGQGYMWNRYEKGATEEEVQRFELPARSD